MPGSRCVVGGNKVRSGAVMYEKPPDDRDTSPRARPGETRRLGIWVGGLVVSALGALIVAFITGLPGELIDLNSAKDTIRPGPDLRARVDVLHLDDQGSSMASAAAHNATDDELSALVPGNFDASERLSRDLRERGWLDVERLTLRVRLEGRSHREIRVVDIRPTDIRRAPPLGGTLFFMPPQEGAASIPLILNMDSPRPVASAVARYDEWGPVPGRPYFESTTIRLADREEDIVMIRATAQRSAVRFRLKIDYLIGGELKSTVIDDDGRPFGITPLNCINRGIASYGVAYEWNEPVKRPVRWQFDLPDVVKNTTRYKSPLRTQLSTCLRGRLPPTPR
jgi:hypothetical protein